MMSQQANKPSDAGGQIALGGCGDGVPGIPRLRREADGVSSTAKGLVEAKEDLRAASRSHPLDRMPEDASTMEYPPQSKTKPLRSTHKWERV